jgi:hypothetical protein
MSNYSKYQQKVIKNYYDNREGIALQRLQELVTELYLAEGKKRDRVLEQMAGHLRAAGVKPEQVDHLIGQEDPQLIAKQVETLLKKS